MRTLGLLNVLLIFLLILSALIPFLNSQNFWWLGYIGLAFPYLLLIAIGWFFFWLAVKPKYSLISLFAILICWKQVGVIIRFNSASFNYEKAKKNIRVLTWNVKVFEGIKDKKQAAYARAEIFAFIKSINPDVVCLQEFSQYDSSGYERDHIRRMKDAGFLYYYFSSDYSKKSVKYRSGVAIFSKEPMINQNKIQFDSNPESLIYADIVKNSDTFRIFTTHLQSYRFNKDDYRNIDDFKNKMEVEVNGSKNLLSKIKSGYKQRGLQAQQIRPVLDSSLYPEIICGDFNDVPNSYAYWQIRGDKKDAFVEKGSGLGRTFLSLDPTLRIDYILCDKKFDIKQFTVADKRLSDHFPLIADVELSKE